MASTLPGFFQGTEMPNIGWWEALWPNPAAVLASIGLKSDMEVIDLCSGDGWFTVQIAKLARHVVAIDIDPELLKIASLRLGESGVTNSEYVAGDAYNLAQLVHRQVDFVFMANAFHGVPDRPRLVRAIRETLKPGGRLAIVNWHPRSREETLVLGEPRGPKTELRLAADETIATCTAGLPQVRLTEVPPYHYGAVFGRPTP